MSRGENYHRTQILLEPEQHKELCAIAQRENRSVSDIVREMLKNQIATRERRALESAAKELLPDYRQDSELTAFTALDAEDFK